MGRGSRRRVRRSAAAEPLGAGAGADAGRAALLARTVVAVQRAGLHGLVDERQQLAVIGVGLGVVLGLDGRDQAPEVRLDRRGVAAVLETLALGAQDPLLL